MLLKARIFLVFVLLLSCLLLSTVVGQNPVSLRSWALVDVTTVPPWVTFISITNLDTTEFVVITQIDFFDGSGNPVAITGFGFSTRINPYQNVKFELANHIPVGMSGIVKIRIIGNPRALERVVIQSSAWKRDDDGNVNFLIVHDDTTRELVGRRMEDVAPSN